MKSQTSSQPIHKIETTTDTISSRGGLALFSRYLEECGIFTLLENTFARVRKSAKGRAVCVLFKQIFCFLLDGTSRHLSYFDHLKQDSGYTATIELEPFEMASSHAIKRFLNAFGWWSGYPFRWVLERMFVWRLKHKQPDIIELYIDTMVMDNDEAQKASRRPADLQAQKRLSAFTNSVGRQGGGQYLQRWQKTWQRQ